MSKKPSIHPSKIIKKHTKKDINIYKNKIGAPYIFEDWLHPNILDYDWTEEEAIKEAERRYQEIADIRGTKDTRLIGYPSDYDPRLLKTINPIIPAEQKTKKEKKVARVSA